MTVSTGQRKRWAPGDTTKWCSGCSTYLPLDDFAQDNGKAHLHGRQSRCRTCSAEAFARTQNDPDRIFDRHLRRTFGITIEDYRAMEVAQGGKCAICGNPPGARRLHVDHNHDTGKVRALLCKGCNNGIGMLREDIDVLASAMAYLIEHNGGQS